MSTETDKQPDSSGNAPEHSADALQHLIPDLYERAESFRVSDEFLDEAVLAAFFQQMEMIESALTLAIKTEDVIGIRSQAHSLHGMGGAAGMPEISVVGEELSRAARSGDLSR